MGDLILIQWGQDFILRFKPNSSKENKINFTENQIDKEQPLSWSAAKPERGVEKKNVLSLSGKFKKKKKKKGIWRMLFAHFSFSSQNNPTSVCFLNGHQQSSRRFLIAGMGWSCCCPHHCSPLPSSPTPGPSWGGACPSVRRSGLQSMPQVMGDDKICW